MVLRGEFIAEPPPMKSTLEERKLPVFVFSKIDFSVADNLQYSPQEEEPRMRRGLSFFCCVVLSNKYFTNFLIHVNTHIRFFRDRIPRRTVTSFCNATINISYRKKKHFSRDFSAFLIYSDNNFWFRCFSYFLRTMAAQFVSSAKHPWTAQFCYVNQLKHTFGESCMIELQSKEEGIPQTHTQTSSVSRDILLQLPQFHNWEVWTSKMNAFNTKEMKNLPTLQPGYHDYSVVPEEELKTTTEAALASLQMTNTQPSFPVKVHQMLEEAEQEGFDDIVGWEVHGR